MSTIPYDCPHCHSTKAGFTIVGLKNFPFETGKGPTSKRINNSPVNVWSIQFSCGAMCPVCNKSIAATLEHESSTPPQQFVSHLIQRSMNDPNSVETIGFKIVDVWPKPPRPQIPEYLPEPITRAFGQAESNYRQVGNEEASAMMYRRALELAVKDKYPKLTGVLAKKVKDLVTQKEIPSAMGDWADEIRDLGNEAAHDQSAIDKRELTMIRGFADALLKYLYTLPAEIEARRKLP